MKKILFILIALLMPGMLVLGQENTIYDPLVHGTVVTLEGLSDEDESGVFCFASFFFNVYGEEEVAILGAEEVIYKKIFETGIYDDAFYVREYAGAIGTRLRVLDFSDAVIVEYYKEGRYERNRSGYIPDKAFLDLGSVEKFILPGSLKSIGSRSFADSENLRKVYFTGADSIAIVSDAFSGCSNLTLMIPYEARNNYTNLYSTGRDIACHKDGVDYFSVTSNIEATQGSITVDGKGLDNQYFSGTIKISVNINDDYQLGSLKVNGIQVDYRSEIVIENIDSNVKVEAELKKKEFLTLEINESVLNNTNIKIDYSNRAEYGADFYINVQPNDGYKITSVIWYDSKGNQTSVHEGYDDFYMTFKAEKSEVINDITVEEIKGYVNNTRYLELSSIADNIDKISITGEWSPLMLSNMIRKFGGVNSSVSSLELSFENKGGTVDLSSSFVGFNSLNSVKASNEFSGNISNAFAGLSSLETVDLANAKITDFRGAFSGCSNLFYVKANVAEAVTSVNDFTGANPNCLKFVDVESFNVWGSNIVVGGICEKLDLKAAYPFFNPEKFNAAKAEYIRQFRSINEGYESIWLPFVPSVIAVDYYNDNRLFSLQWVGKGGSATGDFWLRHVASVSETNVVLKSDVTEFKSQTPYMIAMPHRESLNLTKKDILFRSDSEVEIQATSDISKGDNSFSFVGTHRLVGASDGESRYSLHSEGTHFENMSSSSTTVDPMECYLVIAPSSLAAPATLKVSSSTSTGLNETLGESTFSAVGVKGAIVVESVESNDIVVYDMNGSVVTSISSFSGSKRISMASGIYLVNDKKVVVL